MQATFLKSHLLFPVTLHYSAELDGKIRRYFEQYSRFNRSDDLDGFVEDPLDAELFFPALSLSPP